MKRILVLTLLAASMLAGCGTSPVVPQTTSGLNGSASATGLDANTQVQIYKAFKRVESANVVRLVVMYWVSREGSPREFRQVILDTMPVQDRMGNRSGYRPMQMVVNGSDLLKDQVRLRNLADELGALNYHTVTREQQEIVSLAYAIVMEQVN